MPDDQDEFHHCPACAKRTRHRVMRDRKLVPVLWCQSCFTVRVETAPKSATAPKTEQAA